MHRHEQSKESLKMLFSLENQHFSNHKRISNQMKTLIHQRVYQYVRRIVMKMAFILHILTFIIQHNLLPGKATDLLTNPQNILKM